MKVITLKLRSHAEWEFVSTLLRRLNIRFEWSEKPAPAARQRKAPESDPVAALFGSWPDGRSSDELVREIESARQNTNREIAL